MKLYLSSYRIPTPEDLFELLPNGNPHEAKMAIIVNAKDDGRDATEKQQKLTAVQDYVQELGFTADLFDLRKYQTPKALHAALSTYTVMYAAGGNSFALRYFMRTSGLDELLPALLGEGLVYVGESAGAVVAGPSLRGFETIDTPQTVPEVLLDGLGLIDTVIIPHADDPAYSARVQPIVDLYDDTHPTLPLNNNQAYIVNGSEIRVVNA